MAMTAYVALSLILIFATGSFFFALAESALFSLGKWRAQQLAERAPGCGQQVMALLQAPQDLLATIVLGNTVANGGLLATAFWVALREGWPALPCFGGLVMLILIGGEVVPKTLAVRAPELWSLRVARPMLWMQKLSRPLREVAQGLSVLIIRSLISKSVRPQPALTDEEYQELLEMAYQQGALARSEKEIILQIISLDRRTAKDVMRPRSQMACISDDLSIEDMVAAARRHKHRRLPIYDETPDTIVGILNTRALLLDPQIDLADAIEFPSFVPESMNLLQLLKSLQKQQRGLAIVLDEFGGTAGLVTMEDILEVTIGEIRSETEESGFVMEKLGPGRWRVSGTMRCDDFRREYAELGEVTDADTMGGLIVSQLEVVPAQGRSVAFRGLRMTAQTADDRRVRELLVEVLKKGETG